MKKIGLYVQITLVSLAFAACAGHGTSPTSGIYSGRTHQLIAKHSGKCLDVSGFSQASGTNIIQQDCHGGPNQLWMLK